MTQPWGPPQDPRPIQLDLSEFHPLDHSIFGCNRYGGWRRHLWVWWITHPTGQDRWLKPWWRLRCLFGKHRDAFWHSANWAAVLCDGCGRLRIPSEAELEQHPCFGEVTFIGTEEEEDS